METQNTQPSDEIEINLVEIFRVLVAKLPMMIAVGLLTALVTFLVSCFLMIPTYQSTTRIYILNKQENANLTYSDLQIGTQLTNDYAELIQSRYVLETVVNELGLDMGYNGLKGMVSVTTATDTRIISITVTDTDPVRAMDIANAIREAAAAHITSVMDLEAVNVAEEANLPTQKASPNVRKNTMLGGLIGVLAVAAVAVVLYLVDDTIKTAEDVERYLGLSTLALIPMNEADKKNKKRARKR